MKKILPKEIIDNVSNIQSVSLPRNWFECLSLNKSVFNSLYEWMLNEGGVPNEYAKNIHNMTYVGEKLYKKLLVAEKRRLSRKLKIKPDELVEAVKWSDINSGPKTLIGERPISGDCILVVPESSKEEFEKYSFEIYKRENRKLAKKIKDNAAGATFYQWLIAQVERPDRVGDLARDTKADQKFPQEALCYQDVEEYLSKLHASSACIESLKQGWLEYYLQYPDRVKPYAWCDECGKKFENQDVNFTFCEETLEVNILCEICTNKYSNFLKLKKFHLTQINQEILHELIELYELSEYDIEEVSSKMKLWGIFPINEAGIIYFVKSTISHEIKIGFTSSNVLKRLSTIQTSHPYKLELLAKIPGDRKFEKSLHQKFEKYRLKGEWFQPHPDIINFISSLR